MHFGVKTPIITAFNLNFVSRRQPIYSARVSLNYRVLGLLESDDHIYWFWIGVHDEYDELLQRL